MIIFVFAMCDLQTIDKRREKNRDKKRSVCCDVAVIVTVVVCVFFLLHENLMHGKNKTIRVQQCRAVLPQHRR